MHITYLLGGHCTFVNTVKLFLTVRRLASTYCTKTQQHINGRWKIHRKNTYLEIKDKLTWAKGVTMRSSLCLRSKTQRIHTYCKTIFQYTTFLIWHKINRVLYISHGIFVFTYIFYFQLFFLNDLIWLFTAYVIENTEQQKTKCVMLVMQYFCILFIVPQL